MLAKLQFEEKTRLIFDEKDSLALKSLQEGVVDFADKRVEIKGASLIDQTLANSQMKHELYEVDLGELKSLKENQIHIDEIKERGGALKKGEQLVDDSTLDSQKYKLVMIGRKVSEEEEHHHYLEISSNSQHVLSTDVFHESGEKF